MTKASDNEFPSVLLDEQASPPTTPASGFWRVYAKSDGLYIVDDAGNETGPLTANGGGGGGGDAMTLIEEITVSSSVASITFSSIPNTYDDLILEMELETADAADQDRPEIQVGNGSVDSGSNYSYVLRYFGTQSGSNNSGSDTKMVGPVALVGAGAAAGTTAMSRVVLYRYSDTAAFTTAEMFGYVSGGDSYYQHGGGVWKSTSVIDTIQVAAEGGNLTGGRARLYGRSRA